MQLYFVLEGVSLFQFQQIKLRLEDHFGDDVSVVSIYFTFKI